MKQRDKICLTCSFRDVDTSCPDDMRIPANTQHRKACRRYPQVAWKNGSDWCGEWQSFAATDSSRAPTEKKL